MTPKLEALLMAGRDRETPVQTPRDEGDSVDVARSRIKQGVKEDVAAAKARWDLADAALMLMVKAREEKAAGKNKRAARKRRGPPLRQNEEVSVSEVEQMMETFFGAASLKDGSGEEEPTALTDKDLLERATAADKAAAERSAAREARKAGTRHVALHLRAKLARVKAAECAIRSADRNKRRLRAKIVEVLKDIHRRKTLAWQQERGRRVREQRHAAGVGPPPDLGNATQFTVQAALYATDDPALQNTSPRRAALLGALSIEELEILRSDPAFFFQKNHSGSIRSEENPSSDDSEGETEEASRHLPRKPWDDTEALWELTRFFQPRKEDRDIGVQEWAQKLRARLIASHGSGPPVTASFPWLSMEEGKGTNHADHGMHVVVRQHEEPLEMMPCLGRHPSVPIGDANSPVLAKVREVYNRREVADAKLIEERRQAVEQRLAHNAFKAREQQRELMLKSTTQKELQKVQMLDVEERKRLLEASMQERREIMDLEIRRNVAEACQKAESLVEVRRTAAAETLKDWKVGVVRAKKTQHEMEALKAKEGLRFMKQHTQRLTKIGETKQGAVASMEQRNEQLRARIQTSLNSQMEAHRQQQAGMLMEAIDAKLEAAAMRRSQGANRYHFREKAFGSSASELDLKHQPVPVDRRQDTWRKSAQSWAKQSLTFSSPALTTFAASSSGKSP